MSNSDKNSELVERKVAPKKVAAKNEEKFPVDTKRPERKEIGANRIDYNSRHKLSVKNRDPNFKYRVVNSDSENYQDRVAEMQARGYTICNGDETLGDSVGVGAGQVGSVVGKSVGKGTRGILMKIHKDFFEEDRRQKQAVVNNTEKGMVSEELLNSDSLYGDGVNVERTKQRTQSPKVNIQQN